MIKIYSPSMDQRTEKFMVFTRFVLQLLSSLKLLPMTWNSRRAKFEKYSRSSLQNRVYTIFFSFVCLEYTFGAFRLLQNVAQSWPLGQNNVALRRIISLFAVLATKSIVFVGNLNIMLRKREVVYFTNQLIRLRRKGNLSKDYPGAKVFFVTFSLRAMQMALVGFTKPNKPIFWYSALPPESRSPWFFAIHIIINLQTSLMFLTILFYLINFLLYTETLRTLLQRRATTKNDLWTRLNWYRQLQILSKLFHVTYGTLTVPYITYHSFIVCIILAFGSIRYYDVLDIKVYIQMPISLLLLLSFDMAFYSRVGNQSRQSRSAINSWFGNVQQCLKEGRTKNLICKRACRLIAVRRIKRTFFPSLFRFIVFQTTRLLILAGKHG